MKVFLNALGFLTIFRISEKSYIDEKIFHKILYYFPLVGLIIGLLCSFAFWIAGFIFPGILCIIIAVLAEVFLSGGMHLDGLADTSDGIFSGKKNKEKITEIMKKSDIGAFGVISLIFLFVFKIAIVYIIFIILSRSTESIELLKNTDITGNTGSSIQSYFSSLPSFDVIKLINFTAFFSMMPLLSRWTINFHFARFSGYASSGSLTGIFIGNGNKKAFFATTVYLSVFYILSNAAAGYFLKENFLFNNFSSIIINTSLSVSDSSLLFVLIPVLKSLIIIFMIALFTETAGKFLIKRIGRLSGDAIGAVVEIAEVIYLFFVYILIFIF